MNLIKKILGGLLGIFLMAGSTGCADDLEVRNGLTEGDGMVMLSIPNVEAAARYGATRGDGDENTNALKDAEEGKINKLWFFAFPINSDGSPDRNRETVALGMTQDNGRDYGDYRTYTVGPFKDGGYRVYVLANIEDYLSDDLSLGKSTDEGTIRTLLLNFSTEHYLAAGNLPMGCLNTDIKDDGSSTRPVDEGVYNFSFNNPKNIYADLTFLCAKVRYTLLFDRDDFSSAFGSNDVNFTRVEANNVKIQSAFTEDGLPDGEVMHNLGSSYFARPHTRTAYPHSYDEEGEYLREEGPRENVRDLDAIDDAGAWKPASQRAWQGTIYLPENLDENRKSILNFAAAGGDLKEEYELELLKNSTLSRGKFYDVVTRLITPEIKELQGNVVVHDWTIEKLSYQLHGPYELVVEKSVMPLTAGVPEVLWYRSDVAPENIRFSYPRIEYQGCEEGGTEMFVASVLKDEKGNYVLAENGEYQIEVKVNPNILSSVYNNMTESVKNQISYFDIIAGNIQKRISFSPLDLRPFFTVSPAEIIIDVREYISSGISAQDLLITIDSNISDDVTYSLSQPTGLNGELTLSAGPGLEYFETGSFKLTDGTGKLKMELKNFLEASTFWQTEQTFTLDLTCGDATQTVTFTVKPYTTDYVIHFKAIQGDWESPHIYVYQCLDVPADTQVKDTNGKPIAGKTVGYYTENNTGANAGLEYAFTNNISFRGWAGYGGTVALDQQGTLLDKGFVYFGGESGSHAFNPENGKEDIYDYYNNLNTAHLEHKAKWANCAKCDSYSASPESFNSHGQHLFPGVVMEDEGNGWYKYTLSGVATPGKAMIMFYDGHESAEGNIRRYPMSGQVGVPLFDFADNEGWFVFDGQADRHDLNFYDEKSQIPEYKKFRIYWPKTTTTGGTDFNSIYIWDWDYFGMELGKGYTGDYEDYHYYEFYSRSEKGTFSYRMVECEDDHKGVVKNFEVVDGVYCAYFKDHKHGDSDSNVLTPGIPEEDGDGYYVYFDNKDTNWKDVKVYHVGTEGNEWPGTLAELVDGYVYLYKYKIPESTISLTFTGTSGGTLKQTNDITKTSKNKLQPNHVYYGTAGTDGGEYKDYIKQ